MRTFVAIPVVADLPSRYLMECREFLQAARADVKWVAGGHFHLTLRFVGDASEDDVAALKKCVRALAGIGPIEATLAGAGAFPSVARAQTLWAGVTDPAKRIAGLERSLSESLESEGFPPERKPFHPHITLGRVRSPRGLAALTHELQKWDSQGRTMPWRLDRVTVFESRLTPSGPIYTPLLEVPL
ncbi:MAG TPA: RNA 2',3'-cyclic phosphodiesterase [Armatimonadota bacterium]|jgi:2'-5' RNA ligase